MPPRSVPNLRKRSEILFILTIGDYSFCIKFVIGWSPERLNTLLSDLEDYDFAVAVSGDDTVGTYVDAHGIRQRFECDYSMFDLSQGGPQLEGMISFLELGTEGGAGRHLKEMLCSPMKVRLNQKTPRHGNSVLLYFLDRTFGTGINITTAGNCVSNATQWIQVAHHYHEIRAGTADFESVVHLVSQVTGNTLKFKITDTPTFLRGWWVPVAPGTEGMSHVWIAKPTAIVKIGKISGDPIRVVQPPEAEKRAFNAIPIEGRRRIALTICAAATAKQWANIDPNYPVLGAWAQAVARIGRGCQGTMKRSNDAPYKQTRTPNIRVPIDRQAAVGMMCEEYDWSESDILELEAILNTISVPTCFSTPALEHAVELDYGNLSL